MIPPAFRFSRHNTIQFPYQSKVWYPSAQYPSGTPTTTRLRTWNTLAHNAGLTLVPFLYSIPNSTVDPNEHIYDARNAAAMLRRLNGL